MAIPIAILFVVLALIIGRGLLSGCAAIFGILVGMIALGVIAVAMTAH